MRAIVKFLYKFTDPRTWCIKCGIFIATAWSILVAITVGVTLYIERLEFTVLELNDLQDLNHIHMIEIVIAHSFLWIVGMVCTTGCMMMMRRSTATQQEIGKELEQERDDLAEKNAELARFVYTVSHDLKSPLVTIKGYIGLMTDNINDGSYQEVQKNAITINRAADKMRQLLDELLSLSRVGRVCGDYVCKPLNTIIDDVILNLNGVRGDTEIIVQPDMPDLYGDEIRLNELFQNLIENAVKYMGDQDHPCVEVTAWVEDNEIICCVSDNGVGIEEAYLEKIFDLFEKLDPDVPGSGVGLAVAKRIVEVHHGRIWCESAGPGKGSKFYFSIPRAPSKSV